MKVSKAASCNISRKAELRSILRNFVITWTFIYFRDEGEQPDRQGTGVVVEEDVGRVGSGGDQEHSQQLAGLGHSSEVTKV